MEPGQLARSTARADGNRSAGEVWSRDDDVPFSLGSSVAPILLTLPRCRGYQPKVLELPRPLDVDRRNGAEWSNEARELLSVVPHTPFLQTSIGTHFVKGLRNTPSLIDFCLP